ncbi:MAG: type II secretion system F family protein [Deltaproteobacteria bacterium]|nr:type II secretion system F family protein [Deltaproteobacteria bacterium]
MPTFKYKSATRDGKISEGSLEAPSRTDAVRMIQATGNIPLHVSGKGLSIQMEIKLPGFGNRITQKDLVIFTQEFYTLIRAGLPLDRSLAILAEISEKKKLSDVIGEILHKVEGGDSLADAMEEYPKAFPKLYTSMVRTGEVGGVLDVVLKRLEEYMARLQELKENLISALVYPSLLVTVGTLSMVILMAFVIPKFESIFESVGQSLPLSTTILLTTSKIIRFYWWAILLLLLGCFLSVRYYFRTENGRFLLDRLKLGAPIIGGLAQKIETARFARTLGTLMNSGVPFLQALKIVRDVLQNRVISSALDKVTSQVRGGKGIAAPLMKSKLFPPLALHLIQVGEETGTLDQMLLQVADNYDREFQTAVKRIIALMEPVMILVVALMIGFIVVSMLSAIFSINQLPL